MANKYAESRKAAVKRYLADKKSFNVYFPQETYEELKAHGIDTATIRNLALSELEKRKTGKDETLKVERIVYRKDDVLVALDNINAICRGMAEKMGVEIKEKPTIIEQPEIETEPVVEEVEPETIEEPETEVEPETVEEPVVENKVPSWLDNL